MRFARPIGILFACLIVCTGSVSAKTVTEIDGEQIQVAQEELKQLKKDLRERELLTDNQLPVSVFLTKVAEFLGGVEDIPEGWSDEGKNARRLLSYWLREYIRDCRNVVDSVDGTGESKSIPPYPKNLRLDNDENYQGFAVGTDSAINLYEISSDTILIKSEKELQEILYYAASIRVYHHDCAKRVRIEDLRETSLAHKRWKWLLEDGPAQYPWEMLLNTAIKRPEHIYDFPKSQWVLLHPSISAELNTDNVGGDSQRASTALMVEMIGYLKFSWGNLAGGEKDGSPSRYYGASLITSLRDDVNPGLGVLFRYNKYMFGVIWHDTDLDSNNNRFDDDPAIVLSMDLLGKLRKKSKAYKEQIGNIKKVLP